MSYQWFTKLPAQYAEQDMPFEASFVCSKKTPFLKVRLISLTEAINPVNGVREPVIGSGVEVRFSKSMYRTKNSRLFKLMLESKAFRRPRHGFDIDPHDPSGLWRAMGFVKEKQVVTYEIVPDPEIKEKDLTPKAILDKLSKIESPTPMVDVK